jgi:hypothetical protein
MAAAVARVEEKLAVKIGMEAVEVGLLFMTVEDVRDKAREGPAASDSCSSPARARGRRRRR